MRNFRLNIIVILITLIAASVWLGCLFFNDGSPIAMILLGAVIAAALVRLTRVIWMLVHQMSFFVGALNNRDFMMRFPESDDAELREMFATMNRIVESHRENLTEIETKRYYYDRILKIMSHELRNSITPIVSLSNDMLKRPEVYQGQSLHEGLEVINDQCVSIKRFLDSYYEMTHLPQPKMATIDVGQMLLHIKQLFDRELEKMGLSHDTLLFNYGKGMTIEGDEAMLRQVLINLINNALQATSASEHPRIEITASTPNGKPYIAVADNGTGIDVEMLDDIFQPFYTTRERGTGVGLYISRQIMRQHGGDLTVSSKPGKGAEFTMTFE